ncbi:MAG: cupin domain-containing protein [Actinobacteria bacterium]|nr:cupin domain-containing protein [Actinomycetota bacterium]
MEVIKKNIKEFPVADDSGSLRSLKDTDELVKLRDTFIIFDYPDTNDKYQIGLCMVYPGGKTGGHVHDDAEEIYYIIDGKAKMVVGEEEFEAEAGDTFIVPPHKMHTTLNPFNIPVKFFWSVIRFK